MRVTLTNRLKQVVKNLAGGSNSQATLWRVAQEAHTMIFLDVNIESRETVDRKKSHLNLKLLGTDLNAHVYTLSHLDDRIGKLSRFANTYLIGFSNSRSRKPTPLGFPF